MKHTKSLSVMLAGVMLMGILTAPASAAESTQDGGATGRPTYISRETWLRYMFIEYKSYAAEAGIESVDEENWTIHLSNGSVWVFDDKAYTWTFTDADGSVTRETLDIPDYWADDNNGTLIDTSTGEVVPSPSKTPEPTQTEKPVQYFADVDNNAWYAEAVNAMAASGIINGYDDGLFHPQSNVTTGELCTIIYRIGKNEDPSGKAVPDHPEYTHWASYAVWTLYNTVESYTNAEPIFAEETANRGEAIRAIMALIDDAGLMDNGTFTKIHDYTGPEIPDWDAIEKNSSEWAHRWAFGRILAAYNYGIINGVDAAGTCNPNGTLTRAELCQMLYNAGLTQYTPAEMKDKNAHMGFVIGG